MNEEVYESSNSIQIVVDVAYPYSDNTSKRIHRLRKEQWDIIITAIVFGLTLNLLSDFISSFYDSSVESITLLYRGVVASLAIGFTIVIMICLIIRNMRDECKTERKIQLSFFFDADTGIPYPVDRYIPAARLEIAFTNSGEKQKENLTQLVKNASKSRDIKELIPILELLTLFEITQRSVPIDGESVFFPLKDKLRLEHPLTGLQLAGYYFKVPGCFDLEYKQYEKSASIDITWKNGYHGKMSIDFVFDYSFLILSEKYLTLVPKPNQLLHIFQLISHVNIRTNFSPLRLFFRKSNIEQLINWSNQLSDRLVHTADWDHFFSTT